LAPPTLTSSARPPAAAGALRTFVYVLAVVALCVASRIPQLRSPNLLADGDESILGLMGKHVAEGKEFPIFFYGQHYAFSPVETVAAAASFLAAGVGAIPLKAAGLALWTIGVVFLFLAGARRLGPSRSFWIAALLVLNPAWAVWSLRDGGGYLTSFAASAFLMWLLAQNREHDSPIRWAVAGALTALIYLAQPLWLPGMLPIVAVVLLSRRRLTFAVIYLAIAAAAILSVKFGTATTAEAWGGPTMGNGDLAGSLPLVARQIYVAMTGSYYLYWPIDPPGPATSVIAIIWCIVIPVVVLIQLYRVITRRFCPVSHLLFVSVTATIVAEWTLLSARDPRYMLPLFALLVALAGVEVVDLINRRAESKAAVVLLTGAMAFVGAVSMREYAAFNFLWTNPPARWSEARRLQQVFGYLQVKDVRHVFSMNGMLDSQLTFYSNERVVSRWADPQGRYPAYVREVDRALANGEPVAVVGYTHESGAPGCWDVPICTGGIERLVPNPEAIFTVDGKYFVYVGADRDLLTKLGFRFWN